MSNSERDAANAASTGATNRRRSAMTGAAVALLLVVALVAIVSYRHEEDPGEADAGAATAPEQPTADRGPAITATPTTVPAVASPEDLANADVAGSYVGGTTSTSCEGYSERSCPPPLIFTANELSDGLIISCADAGCAARNGLLNFPLRFDGTSHVGTASFDRGNGCGDGNAAVEYTLVLIPAAAELQGSRWSATSLTGELRARVVGGGCTPASSTFDLSLERS